MGCCGPLAWLCCCHSRRRAGSRTGWEATIARIKGRIEHAEQSRQRATASATFAKSCAIAWVFLFVGIVFAMSRFAPALFAARRHLLALGIVPCPLLAIFSRFAARYAARAERKRVEANAELERELDSLQDELPFNDVVELLRVYDTSKRRLTKLLADSPLQQEIGKLQERNGRLREQTRDLAYLVLALTDAQMPPAVQRWMRAQMMPMARAMERAKPVLDRVRQERAAHTPAARKVMERIQGTPSAATEQPSFLDEVMGQAAQTPQGRDGASRAAARVEQTCADFTTPSPPIRLAPSRRGHSDDDDDDDDDRCDGEGSRSSRSGSPPPCDATEARSGAVGARSAKAQGAEDTVATGTRQRSAAGRKG